jgi:hypothetical protein
MNPPHASNPWRSSELEEWRLLNFAAKESRDLKYQFGLRICVASAICVSCSLLFLMRGSSSANQPIYGDQAAVAAKSQKEKKVSATSHASGTFEVKMTSPPADVKGDSEGIGRFSLDKQFHGDLEGTSKGEMLAISSRVQGSAGYVAMEQVTGKLNGRTGSFALQHTGTMNRGAAKLSVTVVPDSGTGELVGLSGQMDIKITDGKHFYEFDYALTEAP